jgi:hypothetical protein
VELLSDRRLGPPLTAEEAMDFGPILHVVHPSSSARLELGIDRSLRELVDRAVFDRRQVSSFQASSTDTTIDGKIQSLVIIGVDVALLVEAELDLRHPDRPKFRPTCAFQ